MSASDHLKLFPDCADPLTRWRAQQEAEQRQAEAERRDKEREEQQTESRQVALLRDDIVGLRSELEVLSAHVAEREQTHSRSIDEVVDAVCKVVDEIPNWIEAGVKRSHNELRGLIAERFGRLLGEISAISPEARARAARGESFKFANERPERDDEPVDLPNPLPPRRAIN